MTDRTPRGLRIAVNAVAIRGGGGETYLLNILEALAAGRTRHEFLVILTPRQPALLAALPPGIRPRVCRGVPAAPWLRVVWEQAVLPLLLRRWRVDLLFAAFNTAVLLAPVPIVLMAHSVNPYSALPIRWSRYVRLRLAALRWLGRLSARRARLVVFVSETAARVMAPRMGVPPSHVRVVPSGWSAPAGAADPARLEVPKRFILTVGDLQPHKNLEVVLRAFERLVVEEGYLGDLLIVGSRHEMTPEYGRQLLTLHASLAARDRIRFTGGLPHPELFACYRAAELFVFPSLEETFGLPLVEAMGAGAPVVAADWRLAPGGESGRTNVGPEICGEAAEFFDPTDASSLLAALRRILGDPGRRQALARAGPRRAHTFSWDGAAAALLGIFEETTGVR
jgi:glycosyltransferase involved in cell wall biosynthesis